MSVFQYRENAAFSFRLPFRFARFRCGARRAGCTPHGVSEAVLGQFGLSSGPRCARASATAAARPVNQPEEVGPQVDRRIPPAGDDVLGPRRGLLKDLHQRPAQFRDQRNESAVLALVVLGLAGGQVGATSAAIDVRSGQGQMLTGAAHTALAAQHRAAANQSPDRPSEAELLRTAAYPAGSEWRAKGERPDPRWSRP